MSDSEKIVAFSLLTERELRTFGDDLKMVYPLPPDGQFDDLLRAIDEATAPRSRNPFRRG